MKWDYQRLEKQLDYHPQNAIEEIRRHYCHAYHMDSHKRFELLYLIAKGTYLTGNYQSAKALSDYALSNATLTLLEETKWLNLKAGVLNIQGYFVEAHDLYQQSVYRAKLMNRNDLLYKLYSNLGYISNDLQAYREACGYFEKAIENDDYSGNGHLGMYCHYACALAGIGQEVKALELINEVVMKIEQQLGKRWLGFAFESKGRILAAVGRDREALACFIKAKHQFLKTDIKKDLAMLNKRMAQVYLKLGETQSAIKCFEHATEVLIELDLTRLIGNSFYELGSLYEKSGKIEQCLENHRKHVQLSSEIHRHIKKQQVDRLNANVERHRLKSEKVIANRQSALLEEMNVNLLKETKALNIATQKLDELERFSMALAKTRTKDDIYHLCTAHLPRMIGYSDFLVGFLSEDKQLIDFEFIESKGEIFRSFKQDLTFPSYAYHAISSKKTIRIGSDSFDFNPSFKEKEKGAGPSQSMMFVPLLTCENSVGVISVQHHHIDYYNDYDEALFNLFGLVVAGALNLHDKQKEIAKQQVMHHHTLVALRDKNFELKEKSSIDPLTGLFNRTGLANGITQWMMSTPMPCEMVVTVMDLDHFKRFNDTHGHVNGDRLLKLLGKLIKDKFVKDDFLVTRFGGEEFLVIASAKHVRAIGEACVELLEEVKGLTALLDLNDRVTISIGIHTGILTKEADFYNLIKAADQQLYRAKLQGRNQISTA